MDGAIGRLLALRRDSPSSASVLTHVARSSFISLCFFSIHFFLFYSPHLTYTHITTQDLSINLQIQSIVYQDDPQSSHTPYKRHHTSIIPIRPCTYISTYIVSLLSLLCLSYSLSYFLCLSLTLSLSLLLSSPLSLSLSLSLSISLFYVKKCFNRLRTILAQRSCPGSRRQYPALAKGLKRQASGFRRQRRSQQCIVTWKVGTLHSGLSDWRARKRTVRLTARGQTDGRPSKQVYVVQGCLAWSDTQRVTKEIENGNRCRSGLAAVCGRHHQALLVARIHIKGSY